MKNLQQTHEYNDFIHAFQRLATVHQTERDHFSFLQHTASDDILFRIFDFLECQSLVRVSKTCSKFRDLAHKNASQRTRDIGSSRQLDTVMKLLRAKEQIEGLETDNLPGHHPYVQIPILLLDRRVVVSNAGDHEYNGVYYCTGSNGNGFIFTKPRFTRRQQQQQQVGLESNRINSGELLRCIIAKRFSNEVQYC